MVEKITKIIGITIVIISFLVITFFFLRLPGLEMKLVLSPFLICAVLVAGLILSKILGKPLIEYKFFRILIMILIILWFIFILTCTIEIIKNHGNILYSLVLIPFWLFGAYALYSDITKIKKK